MMYIAWLIRLLNAVDINIPYPGGEPGFYGYVLKA